MFRMQAQSLSGLLRFRTPSVSKSCIHLQSKLEPRQPEIDAARKWLVQFRRDSIPRTIGEVTFSRSSGPGGQNVNKVNTKAQLRVPVDQLFPQIPHLLHHAVLSCRFYAEKSRSLLIQADSSRKQTINLTSCYSKLHWLLLELAEDQIPTETSQSQQERVKQLQKLDKEARLRDKKHHASKKASRSKGQHD